MANPYMVIDGYIFRWVYALAALYVDNRMRIRCGYIDVGTEKAVISDGENGALNYTHMHFSAHSIVVAYYYFRTSVFEPKCGVYE